MSVFAAVADSLTRRSLLGAVASILPLGRAAAPAVDTAGHEAHFLFATRSYLARVWTHAEWDRLAEDDRPGSAFPLGSLGWIVVEFCPDESACYECHNFLTDDDPSDGFLRLIGWEQWLRLRADQRDWVLDRMTDAQLAAAVGAVDTARRRTDLAHLPDSDRARVRGLLAGYEMTVGGPER